MTLAPTYQREGVSLYLGDCLEVLPTLEAGSVDAVVTDPPYGLSFMGRKWDYDVPSVAVWSACLGAMKPGAHLLSFAGTRTHHRMACNIEDAGLDIRDMIAWVYGSGFPKSHNLDGEYKGWGTALKPALEPITVARKPLISTVAQNVQEYGTGALNIDGCRVGTEGEQPSGSGERKSWRAMEGRTDLRPHGGNVTPDTGRWPANLIHDGSEEVVGRFPESADGVAGRRSDAVGMFKMDGHGKWGGYGGAGSAARFFYCAKASKRDRDEGCEGLEKRVINVTEGHGRGPVNTSKGGDGMRENRPRANTHPTVKPTDLMRYLCRLITPTGGVVLDPFMGSGSTGKAAAMEGFRFIGVERESEYFDIAVSRIEKAFAERDEMLIPAEGAA